VAIRATKTSRKSERGGVRKASAKRGKPAAAETSAAALLRELADRRAIESGVIAYAHALDSRDYARLDTFMKSDVRVKYGDAPLLLGVAAAVAYCRRALDWLDASQHRLSSIDIHLDGDRATSTAYLCAEHLKRGLAEGERYTVGGSYVDAWERTRAGWRIAERSLVVSWTEGNPGVLGGGVRT
jgi:hypothetical protein